MATKKAGVWIDHQRATVVLMTDRDSEIKKFASGIEKPDRTGGTRPQKRYTPNDFIAEDRRDRKLVSARKQVYEDVLACIRGADALLLLGPGEAKGEFRKHILGKKVRGLTVEVETADKLTDRQLTAKVRAHFTNTLARKSVARKKSASATPEKRGKKAGK